jgi:hypothetical protein
MRLSSSRSAKVLNSRHCGNSREKLSQASDHPSRCTNVPHRDDNQPRAMPTVLVNRIGDIAVVHIVLRDCRLFQAVLVGDHPLSTAFILHAAGGSVRTYLRGVHVHVMEISEWQ